MQKLKRQVFFRFHRDELQINKKFKKYIKKYRNFDYDYDFYTGYKKMTNCMKIGPLID